MAVKLIQDGYKTTDVAKTLEISRASFYYKNKPRLKKNKCSDMEMIEKIKQIAAEHPFWGYRRIWAWLKFRVGKNCSQRKVYNLLKENNLLVPQRPKKAKRKPTRSKPKATRPRQLWGTDMTKFLIPELGWCYLVVVLDWFSKKIVGYSVSLRCRAKEWLEAIEMAVQRECPWGSREEDISLISDNGSQPTSLSFIEEMKILRLKQIFTSYDNPKGNADTERVIRTIKEELLWLEEFQTVDEAEKKIGNWIEEKYNREYLHSGLGYLSPEEFLRKWEEETLAQSVEALPCLA